MIEPQLHGIEIFVVDDDEVMRDTLSAVFVPEGCRSRASPRASRF